MRGNVLRLRSKKYEMVDMAETDEEEPVDFGGIESRLGEARRLLNFLDLQQKIRLISGRDYWRLKPIPSMKIPSLWVCDGPHGLRKQTAKNGLDFVKGRAPATCFPTSSALACSWDRQLMKEVGVAMGRECIAENVSVLLGPCVNVIRTPLGGRNYDYFSEDPLLAGHMGAAFIQGIQSQGVAACAKHFCSYNQETDRWVLDVIVDERTMHEIYWKPWELVVRLAQPWTIMCARNRVNGLYCSENRVLNKRILRDEWGYEGLVMTDWGATNQRWKGIAAGIDLEMPGSFGAHDYEVLEAYYAQNLSEEQIDECGARVLSLMLLGVDVGREAVRATVDEAAHHQLAKRAAIESCVLLKNEGNVLPLKVGTSIAVIGNFAGFPRFQGTGSSQVLPTHVDAAFERFQDHTLNIHGVQGYTDSDNESLRHALLDEAIDAAKENDVAIVFLGLSAIDEVEGMDRDHMDLPEAQEILLEKILDANPKTVVVLTNGSPVTMPWVDQVPAILEGWLGGQGGGSAIADIIFGEAEPCGKLAQTFPVALDDVPGHKWKPDANHHVQYREAMNIGYRYYNSAYKQVLFPFGHGLSYTTFEYSDLVAEVAEDTNEDVKVNVSVTIRNTGNRAGSEIVQCYVYDGERSLYRPYHELKSFEKISLQPNESKTVNLDLDRDAFTVYDVGHRSFIVEPGEFQIQVGASSRDIRLKAMISLSSGLMASADAKIAHPNKAFPIDGISDSDIEFTSMLGYDIPTPPPPTGIFDYDTQMKDLTTSSFGRRLLEYVESLMIRDMENKNDRLQRHVQLEAMMQMPLRGLVVYSRGLLTFDLLDLFLSIMNGEYAYTKALFMAPFIFFSWMIMRFLGANTKV